MTLFKDIYKDLDNKIKMGLYKKGSALPNEGELQLIYGVSRTTIRNAVDQLVLEGKVIRKRGIGLFVSPKVTKQNILNMTGIIKPTYLKSEEKIKIKDAYLRKAGAYYAQIFNISPDVLVYYITLLAFSDEEKTYEKIIMPLDLFPAFDPEILKVTSIIEAINTGTSDVQDIYQDFQLVEVNEEDSKYLSIESGSPVFKITNTFSDNEEKNIAVEYKLQNALTTKYKIDFD